jgi:hypothetical protein
VGQSPPNHLRTGKVKELAISPRHEEWYRQHMTGVRHHVIAEGAGVSAAAVSKALRRVERIKAHEFTRDIKRYRDRCTIRLEHLYKEAIVEWERSKLPQVIDKVGQASHNEDEEFDENKPQFFIERTTKSQTGAPALHARAQASLEKLMELHGIRYVETRVVEDEDEDIAGLSTTQQVDLEIRKAEGSIKRLTEYRDMVQTMEGRLSDSTDSAVATERQPLLETPDDGQTGRPSPD